MAQNIYSPLLLLNVKDGETGQNSYIHIRYSNSPDGNPMLNSGVTGKYIGIYYDSIEEDSSDYSKYKWNQLIGDDGATISSSTILYQLSDTGSAIPTGEWKQLSQIAITQGKYLWTKTSISYTDGTDTTSYSVSYIATDGKNAITYYTWIKYADTPTSGMSDDPEGKSYIGLAYNKTSLTESTNYNDYSWSLIKGEDGAPGKPGDDGITYYTWIKYADDINGTNMSDDPTDKYYIGLAYNKTTSAESNTASDYTWSLFRGSDGAHGKDGISITSIVEYYLATSLASGVTTSTSGWTTDIQITTKEKKYLWNYEKITYSSGSPTITDPVIIGMYSYTPVKGVDYFDGVNGSDGTSNYIHIKYSNSADGTNFVSAPTSETKYIGIATTTSTTAPILKTQYTWSKYMGDNGVQGEAGKDGVSTYIHIAYADTADGVGFDKANGENKKYIGQYTDTNPVDSNDYKDYTWTLIKGSDGTDGISIVGVEEYYLAINNSTGVTTSTPGWTTDIQTTGKDKKYLWNYEVISYSSGDPTITTPVIIGMYAEDAITYYTWIRYADTPTSGMSSSPDGKEYIGIAYNKTTDIPSSNYSDYSWALIKGADGAPGTNGTNGKTYYTWIKYADDSSGNGISDDPTGKKYIGLAHNKETSAESNIPSDYIWSLFKGSDGRPGKDAITYYTWIRYADTPTSGISADPDGKEYIGIAYNKTTSVPSSNYSDYSWALIKGKDGVPGTNGTDGTTYYTWIKYADDINGAGMSESPDGKYYIGIAYNKETAVESGVASDYTWSLFRGSDGIDGAPGRGISSTVINYAKNTDGTTPPKSNWKNSIKDIGELGEGEFLWIRTTTNYTSGSPTVSYSVSRNGINGKVDNIILDIRYSNDIENKTFTDDNGTVFGQYMGLYLSSTKVTIPVFDNYQWSKIEQNDSIIEYSFQYNKENIYRFLDSYDNVNKIYKYSYTPATITINLMQQLTNGEKSDVKGDITSYCYYLDSNNNIQSLILSSVKNSNNLIIDLTKTLLSSYNIQYIQITASLSNVVIASDILYVSWGTSEQMAKLALNATNITAAIDSAKLIFNSDGLTVQNGGLMIKNNSGDKVFFANDEGDLFFAGELHSNIGSLGGWSIIKDALQANNGMVGMHSGNRLFYNNITNDPIRFWSGKIDDDNYNLAITQNGKLYANNADITGNIKATSGNILNKFLIGTQDRGIILSGSTNNNESFISSSQYSSGAFGYGWKLSENGNAEFSNITARGKITSSVFEYDRISSVGGSLYIAPTIYVETESGIISASNVNNTYNVTWTLPYTSLTNINGRDWSIGDIIKIDGEIIILNSLGIVDKKLKLSGIDGKIIRATGNPIKITVQFNTDKYNSSDLVGNKFNPGSVLILYGTNKKRHGLYLTAAGANSPFIDVYDDSEDNTIKPAVRIGNLSGIVDSNFPSASLQGYGLYSSNAYLRGQLMLPGAGITNQETVLYNNSPIRIWAGINDINDDITNANFIVTANGFLYAKQGIFEGTVKAHNSEFSGTIKAAGIVIDENGQGINPESNTDHFFVGYSESPTTFNDYVLDISAKGLSIWEGGLRAYSDWASGENDNNRILPIYGYSSSNPTPQPYFMLADDGEIVVENGITTYNTHARIAASHGHFFTINSGSNSYKTNSIIIDNGLWFCNNSFSSLSDIERSAYYNNPKNGLYLNGSILNMVNNDNINLQTNKTIFINANSSDLVGNHEEAMRIRGKLQLVNDVTNNSLIFGNNISIIEAKKNNTTIGFNFVVS